MYDILGRWNVAKADQEQILTESQMILLGSLWTPAVDAFVKKHMPDPVICIGSKNEAAVYGGIKMVKITQKVPY